MSTSINTVSNKMIILTLIKCMLSRVNHVGFSQILSNPIHVPPYLILSKIVKYKKKKF